MDPVDQDLNAVVGRPWYWYPAEIQGNRSCELFTRTELTAGFGRWRVNESLDRNDRLSVQIVGDDPEPMLQLCLGGMNQHPESKVHPHGGWIRGAGYAGDTTAQDVEQIVPHACSVAKQSAIHAHVYAAVVCGCSGV